MQSPNCMQLSMVGQGGSSCFVSSSSKPHETRAEVVKNPNIYKCQKLVENNK